MSVENKEINPGKLITCIHYNDDAYEIEKYTPIHFGKVVDLSNESITDYSQENFFALVQEFIAYRETGRNILVRVKVGDELLARVEEGLSSLSGRIQILSIGSDIVLRQDTWKRYFTCIKFRGGLDFYDGGKVVFMRRPVKTGEIDFDFYTEKNDDYIPLPLIKAEFKNGN